MLVEAIRDGLALLTWHSETFAYADAWDEKKAAYLGLRGGETTRVSADSAGVLVKPDVAARQIGGAAQPGAAADRARRGRSRPTGGSGIRLRPEPRRRVMRRFHGSVSLDPDRLGRDAGRIAEEIVQHLTTQHDAAVRVTLEIEADLPDGAPDNVVRTVTENARTLKFKNQGFEEE